MADLKIDFVDFWPNFHKADNYFFHLLNSQYNVTIDEVDPEIIFFSVDYGSRKERNKYKNHPCKKIFYTGEGVSPNFDSSVDLICDNGSRTYQIGRSDFAFTFDFSSDPRHYRLPLWALHIDWFNKGGYGNPAYLLPLEWINHNKFISQLKTKFCAAIFSNPVRSRMEAFNALSAYKKVDGFGRPFGNWTDGESTKYDILKNYKFSLCFENRIRPGYYTEKLFHAKTSGTIPLYFSDKKVCEDFNPKSFINLNDFSSLKEWGEYVEYIDKNDQEYSAYQQEPLFCDNAINQEFYPAAVLNFFKNTVLA